MQDPDTPPAVVEGEASGDAGVVRPIVVVRLTGVTASNTATVDAMPNHTSDAEPYNRSHRFGVIQDVCATRSMAWRASLSLCPTERSAA